MKFQKGNKLAKGGLRNPPGGRPSTRELKEIARAADRAREKLEQKFEAITDCYTDLATDREHEATTRHAMENYVLPVAKEDGEARPLVVTFLQFARGPSQPLLCAQEKPGEGLPSPEPFEPEPYEGVVPDAPPPAPPVKFLNFANVPRNGKRRP